MTHLTDTARHWAAGHQAAAWSIGGGLVLLVLAAAWLLVRAARRAGREKAISVLINLAALMATAVQASGMWKFFGNTMGLSIGFRIFMFGFMEVALLACGLRARANVEDGGDAGVDGVLVWVLALASGFMSSTDASSPREALMRVLVAVVVALLWTRDLMAAKQSARKAENEQAGDKRPVERIRWRLRPDRIAIALRLADANDATLTEMETNRVVNNYLNDYDRVHKAKKLRLPMSRQSRLDRSERKFRSHALLHFGDSAAIHKALAADRLVGTLEQLGVDPALAAKFVNASGSEAGSAAGLPESQGPEVRESVSPQGPEPVGESASERVRESAPVAESESKGPDADPFAAVSGPESGLESASPRVRESVGPQGPDSQGPRVREFESVAAGGGAGWPWDMAAAAEVDGSEAAGLIPSMRHTPDDAALVAAQTVNGHQGQPWPPRWAADALSPSQRAAAESAAAGLTESEGPEVRESVSPVLPDSVGPWVRGSESAGGFGPGPDSPRDGSGSASGLGSASGSAGPRVRESVGPQGPDSAGPQGPQVPESRPEAVESDPRWSDETGRLARRIVAENGGQMTRRAFLETFRERGGRIASENRSALYGFALAPVVPTEADLADDTADYPDGIPGLAQRLAGDESEG